MFHSLYQEIIHLVIEECTTKENQDKIKTRLIDPLLYHILHQMYPYLFFTTIIFVLLLTLLSLILYFILRMKISP